MVLEIQPKKSYPIAAKIKGPGPAGYSIPPCFGYEHHILTKLRAPQWSMRPQLKIIDWTNSPGPAAYGIPTHMTNRGKELPPAYSMGITLKPLRTMNTPGPAAYNNHMFINATHPRSPAWHMALPGLKDKPNNFPGPNHYSIPAIVGQRHPVVGSAPAYSMRIKLLVGNFFDDRAKTPGPARYDAVPLERIKIRAPAYTLRKVLQPLSSFNYPGPATYYPGLTTKPHSPAFTMRIKHSEYLAPVKVWEPDILVDWE
ncbi:outer dense fiber protein 3-like [Paramacrobiotus metropolitanus]|uniref:outer dense fiber protein 3-like n=1 Tax=Paramacrobiotus metropolitanus TaxID=2943436 RepID=UPI0024460E50|nr:outer dense fiber protein 3-like [Paramacrobiotus metropolitanus]